MQITQHRLQISNPEKSLTFYLDIMGMQLIHHYESTQGIHYILEYCYDQRGCSDETTNKTLHAQLELVFNPQQKFAVPAQPNRQSGYWKFTIAVGHLTTAHQKLLDNGIEVSLCTVIPNLAYLCHLTDPDGYCIELIQTHLIENTQTHLIKLDDIDFPLGSAAHINLSTLRIKDLKHSLPFYQRLGFELAYTYRSDERAMTLYFLANKQSDSFNEIKYSDNIVETLWQYSDTLLEFQQFDGTQEDVNFSYNTDIENGFLGLAITNNRNIRKSNLPSTQASELNLQTKSHLIDPDGYLIINDELSPKRL